VLGWRVDGVEAFNFVVRAGQVQSSPVDLERRSLNYQEHAQVPEMTGPSL
jgi:hypothetical protein